MNLTGSFSDKKAGRPSGQSGPSLSVAATAGAASSSGIGPAPVSAAAPVEFWTALSEASPGGNNRAHSSAPSLQMLQKHQNQKLRSKTSPALQQHQSGVPVLPSPSQREDIGACPGPLAPSENSSLSARRYPGGHRPNEPLVGGLVASRDERAPRTLLDMRRYTGGTAAPCVIEVIGAVATGAENRGTNSGCYGASETITPAIVPMALLEGFGSVHPVRTDTSAPQSSDPDSPPVQLSRQGSRQRAPLTLLPSPAAGRPGSGQQHGASQMVPAPNSSQVLRLMAQPSEQVGLYAAARLIIDLTQTPTAVYQSCLG